MKKIVLFFILDKYADWEGANLATLLHNMAGDKYCVQTVSLTKDKVRSLGGFSVIPDYDIPSVPADYEALVLIGGMSWRNEAAKQVIPLIKDTLSNNKVLGGICDASGFLGTIGVLNHVNHTGNDFNDLKQWAGNVYLGEEKFIRQQAVRDGNIITANGTASLEFAKEVLTALEVASENRINEWYNFYKMGVYEAPMPTM